MPVPRTAIAVYPCAAQLLLQIPLLEGAKQPIRGTPIGQRQQVQATGTGIGTGTGAGTGAGTGTDD